MKHTWIIVVAAALVLLGAYFWLMVPSTMQEADSNAFLEARIDETFLMDTSALIKIPTYRDDTPDSEGRVIANLERIRDDLNARVEAFNAGQDTLRIEPFEWREEIDGVTRWVFGFRVGDGPRKFSMLTHLDTVPPGEEDWQPFEPRVEVHAYRGGEQPILIGRGAVDNKGPAVLSLAVLEAAAKRFDGSDALADWTLEVAFDTAEETDMNMPYYIAADGDPDLGIVFDARWCIRAEKGIERPAFTVPIGETAEGSLWIASLEVSPGSFNQIPGRAMARIEGADAESVNEFAQNVDALYQRYPFDDPNYRRAPFVVARDGDGVVLTTTVLGPQHGSVPNQNRESGANPLVSLTNFLAGLVDDGTLAANGYGSMSQFIAWGWGTEVFGEKHPDLLERFDDVFERGNGTTYAVNRFEREGDDLTVQIDIRYALGHHGVAWDGVTQGLLPGDSNFREVFDELVRQFNAVAPDANLTYETWTMFSPDVTDPNGLQFQHVSHGYEDVMGEPCPPRAIGGGTDAKGHPTLIAAGALFSQDFGAPINYHGIGEGAPMDDLRLSALILYNILLRQVGAAS